MNIGQLWSSFKLGDKNPDPGRSLLLSLDYPMKRLNLYRAALVRSLKNRGVLMKFTKNSIFRIEYDIPSDCPSSDYRIHELLTKLSNVNDSIGYSKKGMHDIDGLHALIARIKGRYGDLISKEDQRSADLTINLIGKKLVDDMTKSDCYKPLSNQIKDEVRSLSDFIEMHNTNVN